MMRTAVTALALVAATDAFAPAPSALRLVPGATASISGRPVTASAVHRSRASTLNLNMLVSNTKETKTKAGALAIRSTRPSGTGLGASTAEPAKTSTMLLGLYFLGWYVLNVGYNIYVKKTLNVLPLPFTFAVLQLGIGFIWLAPQWLSGIRKVPKPSKQNWKALSKVAAFHGLGQLATVMAMGLGSVSFVNVVKALEPVCTALIALLVTGVGLPWQVWLSMLPVCAGVGMASLSELSFTWACFGAAMTSNVVYATRGVLSKISMTMDDAGENMDAANTYAVVTGIAFLFTLPIALVLEGAKVGAGLAAVTAAGWTMGKLAYMVLCTGLLYYTYNEMAFLVLGSVAPITQSVGNTVKRVVVIVAAALVFRTPMTPMGIAGSTVAILGVLLYSLVRSKFPDVPAKVGQPFRSPKTPFPY